MDSQNEVLKAQSDREQHLELKLRDYVDRCITQKLEVIKDKVIHDLIRKMEEDYRELATYCALKDQENAVNDAVFLTTEKE